MDSSPQESGPRTTATSSAEGRLKVGAGCSHGKSKCLKCAMKKDGKGGPGDMPGLSFPTGSGNFGGAPQGAGGLPLLSPSSIASPSLGGAGGGANLGGSSASLGSAVPNGSAIMPSGLPLVAGTNKPHSSMRIPGGLRPKGSRAMKLSSPSTSALFKSSNIPRVPTMGSHGKMRSLKSILRGGR